MGAQARQAARAQSPAARRDRHDLPRQHGDAAGRRPASATSSRSTPTRACRATPSRRLVGKMAHPLNRPRFDPRRGRVVEGYGVLQPRVTPSLPVGREGSLFQRIFSGTSGIDPYAVGGLRRLPGPVRRRLLSPARASTTSTPSKRRSPAACRRTRCSATICSRASSPAPAWPPTSRSSRNSRRATTSPPRASIAGRAATGSCCPGSSAARRRRRRAAAAPSGDRPLEDARQSAPHAVGAGCRSSRSLAGWTAAARGRAGLDRASSSLTIALPTLLPVARRPSCRGVPASRCAAICARSPLISRSRWRRSALLDHLPRPPGLADARRDRADAVPAVRDAAGTCSNGSPRHRRRSAARLDLRRLLSRGWPAASCSPPSRPLLVVWSRGRCGAASPLPFVAALARSRRPSPGGSACRRRCGGRAACPTADARDAAADRAPHLALLRDLRHGRTTTCCRRTTSRRPARRSSPIAPRRPISASICCRRRAPATSAGSARSRRVERLEATLATIGRARALPRPFLQLVRHARPAPARSALRLVGRQRQSRRPLIALANACREWRDAPLGRRRRARRHRATRSRSRARRCGAARRSAQRRPSRARQLDERARRRSRRRCADPVTLDGACDDRAGRARGAAPRRWSTSRARWPSERRRRRAAPTLLYWARGRAARHRRATRRDLARLREAARAARASACCDLGATARDAWPRAMEFGFLLDRDAQAALDRLSRRRGHARPELLRPARLRGAAGELRGDRQGRRAGASTGSGSAAP